MWARIFGGLGLAVALALALLLAAGAGWFGEHLGPGEVTPVAVPRPVVQQREAEQGRAARNVGVEHPKQILFGDLHVHSTYSFDAFLRSLPLVQGEGVHPVADACDYARFCSALDFWSINDHAEGLTPEQWRETKDAIRQCNAVAGGGDNPDTVAFLGWEWSQNGNVPQNHYGHKNVVLRHIDEDRVPARPIAAQNPGPFGTTGAFALGTVRHSLLVLFAPGGNRPAYLDAARYFAERDRTPRCAEGTEATVDDCTEWVETPAELFRKLDEWGSEALVIPHGNTWGFYSPAGTTWDKQLGNNDPQRQGLIEIFSGHGNAEQYRDWRGLRFDAQGQPVCPEPSVEYVPSCYRAGEIIRGRCLSAGETPETCAARAESARRNYAVASTQGHLTVPGATLEDWLDAGQCRDCFLPAMNHRPGGSAQYALALGNFDDGPTPKRFEFGFIGSSDNHTSRPGTGYKEMHRVTNSESPRAAPPREAVEQPAAESLPLDLETRSYNGFQLVELERQGSFFLTGGLVAAHSNGRQRDPIWHALQRKEVYATSGDRVLLWFDYEGRAGTAPMGSKVSTADAPRFVVRAVGALKQRPGCPDYSTGTLSRERLERLCRGECYNPSDERKRIARIEVVRIRPQVRPNEPIAPLVEDPWRVFPCPPDPSGCRVEFDDPEFPVGRRDATYYVRAIEEPSPTVNAGSLRCERDPAGNCLRVRPCREPYISGVDDDCLADSEERAWSSPIFVTFGN